MGGVPEEELLRRPEHLSQRDGGRLHDACRSARSCCTSAVWGHLIPAQQTQGPLITPQSRATEAERTSPNSIATRFPSCEHTQAGRSQAKPSVPH